MLTAWAVVRNLDSTTDELTFRDFRLRYLRQGAAHELLDQAHAIFPKGVFWGDWLYERRYEAAPALRGSPSGFGRIPHDVEDTLLLLRLFKVGDIAFAAHAVQDHKGEIWSQKPHRTFVDIVSRDPYRIEEEDCARFDAFSTDLGQRVGFKDAPEEPWLEVAKRFFLYGGAKEVNRQQGLLDRILDYAICLEACLLVEADFVGRHVRERAAALVGDRAAIKLVRDYYDVRSKIAHGAALDQGSETALERLQEFEGLVREVLVGAIRQVPRDEADRKAFLRGLFAMSVEEMATNYFERIKGLGPDCEALILDKLLG
jgi:hypothetical protein